jgi:hypothetical protein
MNTEMLIIVQSFSLLIWFQLIDLVTGKPYKKTRADKVEVSSSADVVDFRDAVKAKYDQPGYIKDTPSGALLACKSKAAFVGLEELLRSSHLLDGLGTSKQEALIVLVPSSIQIEIHFCHDKKFSLLK